MDNTRTTLRRGGLAAGALLLAASLELHAQTWHYKVATDDGGSPGLVTLEEKGGRHFVRMEGRLNACWSRRALNAQVHKTAELTTITVEPALPGCEEIRFLIKNDGTGGKRQERRGDDWIDDGFERGLTLRR